MTDDSAATVDSPIEADDAAAADPTDATDAPNATRAERLRQLRRGERAAHRLRGLTLLLFVVLLAVLAVPLVVALVELRRPHWYPLLDMAQTEIRVRDISTGHPPLIGLAGRIGPFGPNGGSHPGPMSFYALWPVWKLFGGSSYGLFASTVALDVVAMGLALWIAVRRGGRGLLLAIAATLAVLTRAYGAFLLTLPWNPYLPVLWWFVFLLAVWSVFADDLAVLPVAVLAGSFCMQTHISYLGLIGGLAGTTVLVLAWKAFRARGARAPAGVDRGRRWPWVAASAGFGVLLWIPPVIDQLAHAPGNLGIIRDYFSSPPDASVGLHRGVGVLLAQLDPWKLLTRTLVHDGGALEVSGSRVPGAVLLAVFVLSIVAAWRLRHRAILLLDAVLVVALGLGLVSAVRIFGTVWFYLLLWAWGLVALLLFVIVWTAVELVRSRTPRSGPGSPSTARARTRLGAAALAAVTLAAATVFTGQATSVTVQTPRLNNTLGALIGPTSAALRQLRQSGTKGPYLVTWLPDAEAIGSAGFGLLNELDRRGFDVRAEEAFRPGATRYHVIDARTPVLLVHLATGPDIVHWQHDSRYLQVAYADPRTDAERATFDELHGEVVGALRAAGLASLVPQVDNNLFMLALAPAVPKPTQKLITRMLDLSMPMAVFVGPPSAG